jgi:hypothetical protein
LATQKWEFVVNNFKTAFEEVAFIFLFDSFGPSSDGSSCTLSLVNFGVGLC